MKAAEPDGQPRQPTNGNWKKTKAKKEYAAQIMKYRNEDRRREKKPRLGGGKDERHGD
jgi:hypothetical protein